MRLFAFLFVAPVAQWIEFSLRRAKIVGSSPTRGASDIKPYNRNITLRIRERKINTLIDALLIYTNFVGGK